MKNAPRNIWIVRAEDCVKHSEKVLIGRFPSLLLALLVMLHYRRGGWHKLSVYRLRGYVESFDAYDGDSVIPEFKWSTVTAGIPFNPKIETVDVHVGDTVYEVRKQRR